ncbi:MAG TPA: hypothetical protein VEW73_00925 [Nocardioides sp.]|jgi:hypothetical protein|nr:hypothetical protein [Nocardioides sp.]
MDSRRDPDDVDPTNQGGRPLLVSGAVIALLVVLGVLVLVYTRAS